MSGAIGIFDSGSGGLSVLKAARARVPEVNVVYFGYIRHAPYGVRSEDDLLNLTVGGVRTLRMFGAQEIVSACATAPQPVLENAAEGGKVIEISRPIAHRLHDYAGGRVLLMTTPASIASGIFATAFGGMVVLDQLSVDDLEAAIEFGARDDAVRNSVRKAFATRWGERYDYLCLGCAHFPLVRRCIEEEARAAFGAVAIIDPSDILADEAVRQFDMNGTGATYFKLSQDSEHFRRRVEELFPESVQDFRIL